MTKKQQQIVAVAVMAVVALVAVGYLFAVKPKLAEKEANEIAAAAATQEVNALNATLAQLQAKEANLPEARAKVEELTTMFPNTFQQDQWFNTMRAAASRAGVTLTQVTPGIPTAATSSTTDPNAPAVAPPPVDPNAPAAAAGADFLVAESAVTLDATGSTAGLAKFLSELERLERPLLIDTIAITFAETEGGASEGTLSISGKTFLTRPMDPPPAIVTGTPTETETGTETEVDPSTTPEVDPSTTPETETETGE